MRKRIKRSLLAIGLSSLVLGSCAGNFAYKNWKLFEGTNWTNPWKYSEISPTGNAPARQGEAPHFEVETPVVNEIIKENDAFRMTYLKFDKSEQGPAFEAFYWESKIRRPGEKRPLLVMSPMNGGYSMIEDIFINKFTRYNGMDILLVEKGNVDSEIEKYDPTQPRAFPQAANFVFENVNNKYQRGIEWAMSNENIVDNCTSTFGISFGGIQNTSLTRQDSRLKFNIFGLAGGVLEALLNAGNEGTINKVQPYIHGYPGGTTALAKDWDLFFHYEPLQHVPFLSPENTLFIVAKNDNIIPYDSAISLVNAANGAGAYIFFNSHVSTWWNTGQIHTLASRFYDDRLATTEGCRELVLEPERKKGHHAFRYTVREGIHGKLGSTLANSVMQANKQ